MVLKINSNYTVNQVQIMLCYIYQKNVQWLYMINNYIYVHKDNI